MRTRLAPNERRQLIVEAAMPLFARKGFSGTTTKEIAEAAQVSEGLLFKYFANKTALYDAIIDYCRDEPSRFTELEDLPPSTETLAETIHHLVFYFATIDARSSAEQSRQRLFMQSLVEDGEFLRLAMKAFADALAPQVERSLQAAREKGDVDGNLPVARSFWLMGLLQIMLGAATLHKPGNPTGSHQLMNGLPMPRASFCAVWGSKVRRLPARMIPPTSSPTRLMIQPI